MWLALAVYTLVARNGKRVPCFAQEGLRERQTLAFRAINISSERTGRGRKARGQKGEAKQPARAQSVQSDKKPRVWLSTFKRQIHTRSTCTCVHQQEQAEMRQPGPSSQECNSSYFNCGAFAQGKTPKVAPSKRQHVDSLAEEEQN